ncbi:MAG TPA: peptidoglycan-binding protein [Candidatus Limnocylindrales bacterium]|nr:peptidoglycan-binding protein [Candidatus Limnocylindrales bacterium]
MVYQWSTEYGDPGRKPGVPRRDGDGGGNPLHQRVMQMQATAGNQAVQQMLQQGSAGAAGAGAGAANAEAKPEILRYGSRGEPVKRLQESLNQAGTLGPELKVDGIMGELTVATLRRFQRSHPPLEVDGTAGPEVMAELERVGDQGAPMPGASAESFLGKGRKLYEQGRYALAFDAFTMAHDLDPDPAYLFNMAQALRLVGGRREEAIKLFDRFLASGPAPEDELRAKRHLAELKGPAPSGDDKKDVAKADELYEAGRKLFLDGEYGRAYDEFSKGWDITHDPALLWNRAMSMRVMGGQRSQAIALFEQVLTADLSEETKAAARKEIEELKGPKPTGDEKKDASTSDEFFKDAKAAFNSEDYAAAYDGFTRAWQVTYADELVWDRAQALRLLGGRREEAIKLYQLVLASDLPEQLRKAARVYIAELKGPGKAGKGGPPPN